jgi:hypothetical protein
MVEELGEEVGVRDVAVDGVDPGAREERHAAALEVVEAEHVVPSATQRGGRVAADEAGGARDEDGEAGRAPDLGGGPHLMRTGRCGASGTGTRARGWRRGRGEGRRGRARGSRRTRRRAWRAEAEMDAASQQASEEDGDRRPWWQPLLLPVEDEVIRRPHRRNSIPGVVGGGRERLLQLLVVRRGREVGVGRRGVRDELVSLSSNSRQQWARGAAIGVWRGGQERGRAQLTVLLSPSVRLTRETRA